MKNLIFKSILLFLVIIYSKTFGQVPETIWRNFQNQQKYFTEKIFMHTDKSMYFANDILWFKAYHVSTIKKGLSTLSKVMYIELLDEKNKPQIQSMVAVKEGRANGSLQLPKSIATGTYKLRAYTNLMKNAGADSFFEKNIYVINALKVGQPTSVQKQAYDIDFFPEGGQMIEEVSANVAFKAQDKNGHGVPVKGIVINDKNDTVATLKSLKFGIGKFQFTPKAGRRYKAICVMPNQDVLIKPLPDAAQKGYALTLTDRGEAFHIAVKSNLDQKQIYLVVHNGKEITYAKANKLTEGKTEIEFKKAMLSGGLYYLTAFDSEGRPVAERMFFEKIKHKFSFKTDLPKTIYSTREQVDVSISAVDEQSKFQSGNASLSIYKIDSLQTGEEIDIVSDIYLRSALKGRIDSPSYYFSTDDKEVLTALDNLLLTQGWRKFDLSKPGNTALRFLPEYNDHLVSGKVQSQTGEPIKNLSLYFSSPKKAGAFYVTKTDSLGAFLFNTDRLFGQNEVIIQANYLIDSTSNISVASPYFEEYSQASKYPGQLNLLEKKKLLEDYYFSSQVQDIYAKRFLHNFSVADSAQKFYGAAQSSYRLSDFTKFNTLEDVFREYIREIHVFKKQGKITLRAMGGKEIFEKDPFILYDGIPYFDLNKMMSIYPDAIERIEIFKDRYFYSGETYEGIIQLFSKKASLSDYELNPKAIVIDYEGMQLQREFYSPKYDTDKNHLPDYRTTLHWEPNLLFNGKDKTQVSFYTSDISGRYIGVIQGVSVDGTPGVMNFEITVKK